MDATEGLKETVKERKKLTDKQLQLMRQARIASKQYRQERMDEQRRQE